MVLKFKIGLIWRIVIAIALAIGLGITYTEDSARVLQIGLSVLLLHLI